MYIFIIFIKQFLYFLFYLNLPRLFNYKYCLLNLYVWNYLMSFSFTKIHANTMNIQITHRLFPARDINLTNVRLNLL